MGLNDEDEDLVALRLAALSTMKAKRASENSLKLQSSPMGGVSIRDGFGNRKNAVFQPHYNSNLIAIVPISSSTQVEQPRSRKVAFSHQKPESKMLILPQHRYCKTEAAIAKKKEKPAVKTKFNRYDSSSSDSSEESEDEGSSTASGGGGGKVGVVVAPPPVETDTPPSEAEEPSFLVELEVPVEVEREQVATPAPVVEVVVVAPLETLPPSPRPPSPRPPSPRPYASRPPYADRSRSRTRTRSRSRSRSRPRLARSRSPRARYGGPRRSVSPKRRGASPPRHSPLPPTRRRSSPRRRYGSPLSPPRRRSSPWRLSPLRRRESPSRLSPIRRRKSPSPSRLSPRRRKSPSPSRLSPRRRKSPSPLRMSPIRRRKSPSPLRLSPIRRRKSPSPVKRNPSPPRRFSPQRRSPLGRRVSPPRRNPSPPRKLYSPRRYSPPSPRRYNPAVGGMSPWSPPPSPPPGRRRRGISPPPKRRRSFSPRGQRPASKKRSVSPGSSPANRRLDPRDSRAPVRGPRDTNTTTTTAPSRADSRSLSLSPPPDRVKVKSPLRVRSRRHERANGKKRSKSKKSRNNKTPAAPAVVEKTENKGDKSSVLEARRRKFESADPIGPANKKIRLKTATTVAEAVPESPKPAPSLEDSLVEEGERPDTPPLKGGRAGEGEVGADDDALVLDSPADLWSDDESDSGNEGRFKSNNNNDNGSAVPRNKVSAPSFSNLLQPSGRPTEPNRRRSPAPRDKKRRRERGVGGARGRTTTPASLLDRIGGWRGGKGAPQDTPDRLLPALLSKDIPKPEQVPRPDEAVETTQPEPTNRVSRLESADQCGDLRAALSRKRAARSNVLFPFKGDDTGKVPGSRLVQSAFLDAVGKKQKRSRKSLTQPPFVQMPSNLAGAAKDARRVTLYDKVKASVKQLSASVTVATDESTLATETQFSDEDTSRKAPVRLRLGLLPQRPDPDHPGGRKVKLKRNNKNAASDQGIDD